MKLFLIVELLILVTLIISSSSSSSSMVQENPPSRLIKIAADSGEYDDLERATTECAGLVAAFVTKIPSLDSIAEMVTVMETMTTVSIYLREVELKISADRIVDEILDISYVYENVMLENITATGNLLGTDKKLASEVDSCFILSNQIIKNLNEEVI